jgi:asparagine synthase (glutamine-hydrolysing)
MQSRADLLGRLVAAQPGVAEALPDATVRAAFAAAEADPQRAWSLLFYALWHSRHVLGRDPAGDVESVLRDSARP